MKVVIVGGVAAGGSAAARLRRLDETAEIVVLEKDQYVSFANCGLPYHIGGIIPDRAALLLQTPESLAASLDLDVRVQHEVTGIDRAAKTVAVRNLRTGETYLEAYDKLVLCPGADPVRPPIEGADHPRVHTLRNIPDMDRIIAGIAQGARRGVVVGGSYIGLEVAEGFHAKGLDTAVVEMSDRLMPWLDPEMTRILHYHVFSHGVDVRLGTGVTRIAEAGSALALTLADGTTLETDIVVMATGVRPKTGLARAAGLELGPKGGIRVDATMRTSDPDIYAAGDAVETEHLITGAPVLSMLAGPANRQGRIVADAIMGNATGYRGTQGTGIVKVFDMTAGGTGLTEAQLAAAGIACRKVHLHPNGHSSYYPGTAPMFMKVLFAPDDGKLLGAQIVGWDGVDKRIDVLAVALRAGMTIFDLEHLELAYAPPYSAAKDPVNLAGFMGANLLRGQVRFWYPEDYPAIGETGTILDVRSDQEHAHWTIPGARHITHTALRDRLDELPRDRPVYAYCRSGFRSYLAYCILKHAGFEAATLAGGLMTYHGFHRTPLAVGQGGMPMVTYAEDVLAGEPGVLEHV
jgi:NADPH-dependent 2,4-dienoyl-CoA reductase/sulfur reductase-like enzyme/rhodanese-related sulfurtransferase